MNECSTLSELWHFIFADNYEKAVEFKERRRNLEPAIYNANRLREKPVPDVRLESAESDQADSDDDTIRRLPNASNNNSLQNEESIGSNENSCDDLLEVMAQHQPERESIDANDYADDSSNGLPSNENSLGSKEDCDLSEASSQS